MPHYPVLIIGGGQAGLSMSYHLKVRGIDHLVLEKHRIGHAWRDQRWDTFCLVTPNWQCKLPGYGYTGDDPMGFMKKDEIVGYLEGFVASFKPPVREGVAVTKLSRLPGGIYEVQTSGGTFTADDVVVAVGGYHTPVVPRFAEKLPAFIKQIHSADYKNSQQLPDGDVMVVGSGQSGCQIAEDLHIAGRRVHLCTGGAPRVARRYRGKDVVEWLDLMGFYDLPVEDHPLKQGVRTRANHYVTGRDGGRDIDLRQRAAEGMRLHGRLKDIDADGNFVFGDDLKQNLDKADETYISIQASIDKFIAKQGIDAPPGEPYKPVWEPRKSEDRLHIKQSGIHSVVWAIGYRRDFSWIEVPVFDGAGYPGHSRGITPVPGLYFLGLPWLHTWGSGRFCGVANDAKYLADRIETRHGKTESVSDGLVLEPLAFGS